MRISTGRRCGIWRGISLKPVGLPISLIPARKGCENLRNRDGETRQRPSTVEGVALGKKVCRIWREALEHGDGLRLWIDQPDQACAGLEVFLSLLLHFSGGVGITDDLDRKRRRELWNWIFRQYTSGHVVD